MRRTPRRRRARACFAVAASITAATLVAWPGGSGAPAAGQPSPSPTALETPRIGSARPRIESPSAILLDVESGGVLYRKAPAEPRPIASLTKIMTALVVLESVAPNESVTVGATAADQPGSSAGLEVGERMTVRHLLYALLLASANDAAVALAEHVAGSVPAFVAGMNRRAAELSLSHTRFFSASGLDDRGFSTAADVAALTQVAMANPTFAEIVRTKEHRLPAGSGERREVANRNVLLWLFPGTLGVKTGLTSAAGHCISAVAVRGGRRLIAVVLGHPDLGFDDTATLLTYGFNGFRDMVAVVEGETVGEITIGGRVIEVQARRHVTLLVSTNPPATVTTRLIAQHDLALPIVPGQRVGRVVVTVDGERAASVPAVSGAFASETLPSSPGREFGAPGFVRGLRLAEAAVRALAEAFL